MATPYELALMDPANQARALEAARQIRGQEARGVLGMLTGDPLLGQLGRTEFGQAQARTEGLRKARQAARQIVPVGGGYIARGGVLEEIPGYREFEEQKAQRALEKALAVAGAGDEQWYARRRFMTTLPTPAQASAARETMSFLPEFQEQARQLYEQDIEIPAIPEAAANFVRDLPLGESLAPAIERWGLDPEVVRWLDRGRQAEADVMRIASGLQLTAAEIQNIKKFSPWAANLTRGQRTSRMQNIFNTFGRKAAAILNKPWEYREFTPGYLGVEQAGAQSVSPPAMGDVSPVVPAAAPAPSPAPAPAPVARVPGVPPNWSWEVR